MVIDLETVMDPPKRLPIFTTWNLKDKPPKSSPNPKEEDLSEFDIFKKIRFGLVNNSIFEVQCPIGLGMIKKISGRQLHWAYKEWKKKIDSIICSYPVNNITMPGTLGV